LLRFVKLISQPVHADPISLAPHPFEEVKELMLPIPRLCLLAIASVVLLSGDDPSWKEKTIPQWDDQDAKQVLADSPWVKSVKLERVRDLSKFQRRDGGNMSAGVPPYVGAFWFDLSALDDLFGSNAETSAMRLSRQARADLGNVVVRWESALPVRAAERKAGEVGAPVWQGDYYALAVYDVPPPFRWNLANELKGLAFLQRGKKKDLKPSRVEILPHDNGLMTVVYLFPRSAEITPNDSNVRFMAQIGRLFVSQFFFPEEMQFQGNPEL
jgi:hypothetical protein